MERLPSFSSVVLRVRVVQSFIEGVAAWRGPRGRDRPRGCLERRRDLLLRGFPVLLVLLRDVLQEGVICPLRGFEDGFYPQVYLAGLFVCGGVLAPPLRVLLSRQLETSRLLTIGYFLRRSDSRARTGPDRNQGPPPRCRFRILHLGVPRETGRSGDWLPRCPDSWPYIFRGAVSRGGVDHPVFPGH